MFTRRCRQIPILFTSFPCLVWQHRKISALVGIAIVVASAAGVYYWWYADWWTVQRAMRLDLVPVAERSIEAYLRKHPADAQAHLLAARIQRLLENHDIAEGHLERYKEIAGTSAASQLEMLLLRVHQGDLHLVESSLLYTVSNNPAPEQEILIYEALSRCYVKELRYRAAMDCLMKWLKKEPDNLRALASRGVVFESMDFFEDARKDYEHVLDMSPEHMTARIRLVNLLLANRNTPKAAEHVKILERTLPDHPEVITAGAQLRLLQGHLKEAQEILDRYLVNHPRNVSALYLRGKVEEEPGAMEKWFRKALAIDASFSEAQYSLYLCLSQQPGRGREADEVKKQYETTLDNWKSFLKIKDALERTPHNPDLLTKAGRLLLDRYPVAGQNFLYRALQIDAEQADAHEALARFFETHGDPEKAALHRKTPASAQTKTKP